MDDNLGPDVRLALAAIAAELGVDPDELPAGIEGILRAFGAARYAEAARDFMHTRGNTNRAFPAAPIDEHDPTPVVGRYGRRRR